MLRTFWEIPDLITKGMPLSEEILSFGWGLPNENGGSVPSSAKAFYVYRSRDKNSPLLVQAAIAARPLPKLVITVRNSDGKTLKTFLRFDFKDVIISDVRTGTFGEDVVLMDYAEEKHEYTSPLGKAPKIPIRARLVQP